MNLISDEDLYSPLLIAPEKAFKHIYDRHSGPLLRFIYRFTANAESAEEILHDVFFQLLSGKFMVNEGANLKSWLYTTAKNKGLNWIKKSNHIRKTASLVENIPFKENPEEEYISRQNMQRLAIAEKNLPRDLSQTWLLRKQGFDYRQIATKLSIPVGTVKSRFNRLAEYLKKEFENGS